MREALAPLSGIAMVSRIRVEVRGSTMEAAEEVANLFLDHARMAGYLEGITPQSGNWTDHHFNYPQMTGRAEDPPDPWSELGLRYAGRMAFTFEPASQLGGIQQHGFEVIEIDNYTPHGLQGHPGSEDKPIRTDVTEQTIVLHRRRMITHFDERSAIIPHPMLDEEATAEEILDNIVRLRQVTAVETTRRDGEWVVNVDIEGAGLPVVAQNVSLREAALEAYGECGVPVIDYTAEPPSA